MQNNPLYREFIGAPISLDPWISSVGHSRHGMNSNYLATKKLIADGILICTGHWSMCVDKNGYEATVTAVYGDLVQPPMVAIQLHRQKVH